MHVYPIKIVFTHKQHTYKYIWMWYLRFNKFFFFYLLELNQYQNFEIISNSYQFSIVYHYEYRSQVITVDRFRILIICKGCGRKKVCDAKIARDRHRHALSSLNIFLILFSLAKRCFFLSLLDAHCFALTKIFQLNWNGK